MFPAENDYRAERRAFLATIESLTPDELEHGPTLCASWAPRDVLGHVLGVDEKITEYVRTGGNVHKANARLVERFRALDRDELLARAREWAASPALLSRMGSFGLLGDLAVHHQDVVRGLGRHRDVPEASARAILREGMVLGAPKLRRYRVAPPDTGGAFGRGQVVRGTAEALGMWLGGRRAVEAELVFGDH